MSYRDRMAAPGQKKLLTIDGGGIRGVLSLEILRAVETMLRREMGASDDFVLADYFDYVSRHQHRGDHRGRLGPRDESQ